MKNKDNTRITLKLVVQQIYSANYIYLTAMLPVIQRRLEEKKECKLQPNPVAPLGTLITKTHANTRTLEKQWRKHAEVHNAQ